MNEPNDFKNESGLAEGETIIFDPVVASDEATSLVWTLDGQIDDKAHEAATSPNNDLPNPTPAQLETGNYKKGHVKVAGLDIAIENPEGSERKGVSQDGKPWSVTLKSHYGYIKRTQGNDGDHVDVFLKPETEPDYNGPVFVISQMNGEVFDEHKVMLGWEDEKAAKAAYLENYAKGWKCGPIECMSPCAFRSWLESPPVPLAIEPEPLPVAGFHADLKRLIGQDSEGECATDELESDAIVLECDASEGLAVLKIKITQVDIVNKNRRRYKKDVANAAVDHIKPYCKAGVVLGEIEHPAVVSVCDRGVCGQKYVNGGPESQILRWRDIFRADSTGWIWGEAVIPNVPEGHKLLAKARKGERIGVSSRLKMDGVCVKDGSATIGEPTWMRFESIDVVTNPAVDGAGEYTLLADDDDPPPFESESGLGEPFDGDPRNTLNPPPNGEPNSILEAIARDSSMTPRLGAQELTKQMNKEIQRLLRLMRSKIKAGACVDEVNGQATAVADAIRKAYFEGDDVSVWKDETLSLQADAIERIPGFKSGEEGPIGVLANELGDDPSSGWGARELIQSPGTSAQIAQGTPTMPKAKQTMTTADEERAKKVQSFIDKQMADAEASQVKAERDDAVNAKINEFLSDATHPIHKLSDAQREDILNTVRLVAPAADTVPTLIDAHVATASKAMADATLAGRGIVRGQTTNDISSPIHLSPAASFDEGNPFMNTVGKMTAAYDSFMRENPSLADEFGWEDPEGPFGKDVLRRRKENLERARPIIEGAFNSMLTRNGGMLRVDSVTSDEGFFDDLRTICSSDSAAYNTVVANLYNQPTIFMWLLIQPFQDCRFLEFFSAYGPGQNAAGNSAGWENRQGFGRVFRVPSETVVEPTGFSGTLGMPFDLNVAENSGIPTLSVDIYWDTFAATWRKVAATLSMESINAIGRGPLNYPAVMRHLWHMAARKSRSIDSLMGNEMMNAALEYSAVVVTSEAYTTGGSGGLDLAANSVAVASGAVTVNLNTAKIASAAVASTDKFIIYGTGNSTGGVAPLAALRLQAGGGAGAAGTGTYFSTNTTGPTPVVPPRSLLTLTGPGADSASTLNPISISLPANQVLGYLGPDGNIYSIPGTTATFAVDFLNGVVVFKTGQVTRSGSVFTTATTVTYSYATNFDYFVLGQNNVNQVSLGTGETLQSYYNKALSQIDLTAAAMGSSPNFVKPDLEVTGLNVAARLIQATLFYKLNSPDGTELFPDETFFARRNGVNLARVNAVTYWAQNASVVTRRGTGRYAVDTPAEIRGPITLFDSNGLPIAGEGYYLAENSAICTPQVKDIAGVIKSSVSRAIVWY